MESLPLIAQIISDAFDGIILPLMELLCIMRNACNIATVSMVANKVNTAFFITSTR
jgi:hypothetical protein